MTEIFTVDFNLSLAELLSATYYMTSKMKFMRRLILFSFIVALAATLLNFTSPVRHSLMSNILSLLLVPAFPFLFFFLLISLMGCLLYVFKFKHLKNVSYHFSHWGMEKTGKGINFTRPWNKFLYHRQSKHFIFLYIAENDAHIIQKRKFKNGEELNMFISFISKQIPRFRS